MNKMAKYIYLVFYDSILVNLPRRKRFKTFAYITQWSGSPVFHKPNTAAHILYSAANRIKDRFQKMNVISVDTLNTRGQSICKVKLLCLFTMHFCRPFEAQGEAQDVMRSRSDMSRLALVEVMHFDVVA